MAKAVHVGNQTAHGVPLTGNGSPNVFINGKPAWRAIPAGVGDGLEEATKSIKKIMDKPLFAPPDVAPELPKIQAKMMQSASKAADAQNPTAVAGVTSAFVSLTTTTVALTAAYTAGAAVPGGEPAARSVFTMGFKTALSAAAGAAVTAIGGSWDMHTCSLATPNPHGPGLMTRGAETVFINGFRAAIDEEVLFEASQGPVGVSTPSQNVFIGKGVSFGRGASVGGKESKSGSASAKPVNSAMASVGQGGKQQSHNQASGTSTEPAETEVRCLELALPKDEPALNKGGLRLKGNGLDCLLPCASGFYGGDDYASFRFFGVKPGGIYTLTYEVDGEPAVKLFEGGLDSHLTKVGTEDSCELLNIGLPSPSTPEPDHVQVTESDRTSARPCGAEVLPYPGLRYPT